MPPKIIYTKDNIGVDSNFKLNNRENQENTVIYWKNLKICHKSISLRN